VRPTLLCSFLVGCGGGQTSVTTPEPTEPVVRNDLPDVVMITLDTTRADRIGSYGYEKAKTENLDALAARGRRYARAYSPLPLTIPSHSTMFTGKYPPTLKIRSNGAGKMAPEEVLLSERLKEAGYATAASVAAFVTTREWGFDQGFDAYFDDIPEAKSNFWHAERAAEVVIDDILGWHERQTGDQPEFAWIHLYDPHFPFQPPVEYKEEVEGRPYDGELAYVDDQLKRVFDAYGEDALYIVIGDHGEGLGEHNELTHGLHIYNNTQQVPFIITGPGIEPSVIDQPVSLADMAPTVLSLLDLPPLQNVEGRVVPAEGDKAVYLESYQYMERFGLSPHRGVVQGQYKLISLPHPELYDLVADPQELTNLAADKPEEVARLQASLDAFGFGPPLADPSHPVDPTMISQLEALGYVEGGFAGDTTGPLPDPKEHKTMIIESQKAERLMREKKLDEAIVILEELIEGYPEVVEFRSRLSMAYARTGRSKEAGDVIEAAVKIDPDNAMLKYSLGVHRAKDKRFHEASILFREAADALPYSPRIRSMAVAALLDAGDTESAVALGLEYLERYPDDYSLAGIIGVVLLRGGRTAEGEELVNVGLMADVAERDVAFFAGVAASNRENVDETRELLRRELKHYPGNTPAAKMLISSLVELKDWQGQVDIASGVLEVRQDDAVLWHTKAQALFNLQRFDETRVVLDEAMKLHPEVSILYLLDANLLSKEGKKEEANARFQEAKKVREKEAAKARAEQSGVPMGMKKKGPGQP
jgi:arylsulfatase A-like enzyme/tetratricopeptide (TPR) repeat protein